MKMKAQYWVMRPPNEMKTVVVSTYSPLYRLISILIYLLAEEREFLWRRELNELLRTSLARKLETTSIAEQYSESMPAKAFHFSEEAVVWYCFPRLYHYQSTSASLRQIKAMKRFMMNFHAPQHHRWHTQISCNFYERNGVDEMPWGILAISLGTSAERNRFTCTLFDGFLTIGHVSLSKKKLRLNDYA